MATTISRLNIRDKEQAISALHGKRYRGVRQQKLPLLFRSLGNSNFLNTVLLGLKNAAVI